MFLLCLMLLGRPVANCDISALLSCSTVTQLADDKIQAKHAGELLQ